MLKAIVAAIIVYLSGDAAFTYVLEPVGLGYLHAKGKVRKTLRSIYKHNFKKTLHDHMSNSPRYSDDTT